MESLTSRCAHFKSSKWARWMGLRFWKATTFLPSGSVARTSAGVCTTYLNFGLRVHRDTLRVGIVDDVLPAEAGHRVQRALAVLPDVQGDALSGLVHAATSDENVLVALRQSTLEGLDFAHKVEVCRVHVLAVAILCDELVPVRHVSGHLPQRRLAILLLDLLRAHRRRREEVHGVDSHQVHAGKGGGKVLVHQGNEDVVGCQPRRGEDDLLPIRGQILLDFALETIHLPLQGRAEGRKVPLLLRAERRRRGADGDP
mmetsp:Transcript_133440/g.426589  ORF Transcript_133440/g.426589 Transcript_133440/m.426589 type:complete len:257 (-) Transcript_133440:85-855(-)